MARYLSELKGDQLELRDLLKLAGLVGLPMALVMIQPDLGTALTYLPILGVGVFLAGFRWQYAAAIVVIVAVIAPISYWLVLKDYQTAAGGEFSGSKSGPEGIGLSGDPVENSGGGRRALGARRYQGYTDPGALLAGAAEGFYFFGLRRRARIRGRHCGAGVVFLVADADRSERADRVGSRPGCTSAWAWRHCCCFTCW